MQSTFNGSPATITDGSQDPASDLSGLGPGSKVTLNPTFAPPAAVPEPAPALTFAVAAVGLGGLMVAAVGLGGLMVAAVGLGGLMVAAAKRRKTVVWTAPQAEPRRTGSQGRRGRRHHAVGPCCSGCSFAAARFPRFNYALHYAPGAILSLQTDRRGEHDDAADHRPEVDTAPPTAENARQAGLPLPPVFLPLWRSLCSR